jgi:hypothetical protein
VDSQGFAMNNIMVNSQFLEKMLAAMEGVIDVADRKTDEFEELRSCVINLTLMLHSTPQRTEQEPVRLQCVTCGTVYADGVPPQVTQPEQEPVAWVCEGFSSDEKHAIDYWQGDVDDLPIGTQLYTNPPPRTWVGLTDEDFENAFQETYIMGDSDLQDFAKVIEAQLKDKNT